MISQVGQMGMDALPWMMGALLLLMVAWSAFRRPLIILGRFAIRTGAGLICLHLLAPVGEWIGVGLGVNLLNALVLGVLGVPGLGLLLLLKWTLRA